MAHAHFGNESLEPFAIGRGRPRLSLVMVDDDDPIGMPPKRNGTLPERVLPFRALRVVHHLTRRGLTDIEVRVPFQVPGVYLLPVGMHGVSDRKLRRMPARMQAAWARTSLD